MRRKAGSFILQDHADTLLQGALIQGALAIGHHAPLGVDEIGGGDGYHAIPYGRFLLGIEVNGEGIPCSSI